MNAKLCERRKKPLSDLAASTRHSPEPSERGGNQDHWGRFSPRPDVPLEEPLMVAPVQKAGAPLPLPGILSKHRFSVAKRRWNSTTWKLSIFLLTSFCPKAPEKEWQGVLLGPLEPHFFSSAQPWLSSVSQSRREELDKYQHHPLVGGGSRGKWRQYI